MMEGASMKLSQGKDGRMNDDFARGQLDGYVAACKAVCDYCSRLWSPNDGRWTDPAKHHAGDRCNPIRALIADWHKAHDPKPKCEHEATETFVSHSLGGGEMMVDVQRCKGCGMIRRIRLGDWEKPDATA
jgi:hypothetical protein